MKNWDTELDKEIEAYKSWKERFGGLSRDMTLRDYFAAKALQAIMTAGYWNWKEPGEDSARCYAMADAMIKAREQ